MTTIETLSVRIGIATGPVVVGEQAGEGDQSKLAVGSTPNLAARPQRLAGEDQIVIPNRRAEGFECIETAKPIVHRLGNRFEESCCLGVSASEYGAIGRFNESCSLFDDAIRIAWESAEQSIEG